MLRYVNQLLAKKITKISSTGHGVIESSHTPDIYVLGAFPGDVIDISIYKKLKNIWYGEIIKFHEYSEYRSHTPTQAPFFIPNMPWEHLSIEGEYLLKQEIFESIYPEYTELLQSITHNPGIPQTGYRNKVAYAFETNHQGSLVFALYGRGTSNEGKQEQQDNSLVHSILEKVSRHFLHFLNQHKVQQQDIKYLILRYSYVDNAVVAHVLFPETNRKKLPIKKEVWEKFLNQQEHLTGIVVSHSEPGVRSAITNKDFYSLGNINVQECVLDKTYTYHPSLFFQIYPKAFEEILIDLRSELSKIPQHNKLPVLDLFAGVGIIGIEIADLVPQVTGVELSSLSKEYAINNAQQNNIHNYEFIESSVDKVLDYIQSDQILILDPTRSGLSKHTCNRIREVQPQYIVYISCNPETQARDIKNINDFYTPVFIKSYNLFPKTHHIESMVILKKND